MKMETDGHPKSLMCSSLSRDKIEDTNFVRLVIPSIEAFTSLRHA